MKPYYDDGRGIVIYNCDNKDILSSLPQSDFCLTDPPYDAVTHAGALTKDISGREIKLVTFDSITVDDLRDTLSLIRLSGWLVATMDWRHILPLEQNPPTGMKFVRFGMWDKPTYTPQFTGDRPATGWEAIGIFHSKLTNGKMKWNGGGERAVYRVNKEQNNKHPTEKPAALIGRLMSLFSQPNHLMLDPWMGSGVTLVCAKATGRRAIGIEKDEQWCEIAARRLSQECLPLAAVPPPVSAEEGRLL